MKLKIITAFIVNNFFIISVNAKVYNKLNPLERNFYSASNESNLVKRAAHSNKFWYKGKIYFKFDNTNPFTENYKQQIQGAMIELSKIANISFIEENEDEIKKRNNYVTIYNSEYCAADVGPVGKNGVIFLNEYDCPRAAILHELKHTLGFEHEHMRSDRDHNITIFSENIKPNEKDNFDNTKEIESLFSYDEDSIMHYDSYASSINNTPTMLSNEGDTIPINYHLSDGDKKALQTIYGLPKIIKFYNGGAYNASIQLLNKQHKLKEPLSFSNWWGYAGQENTTIIPKDISHIIVKIEASYPSWKTIKSFNVTQKELPICFETSGSIFNPKVEKTLCWY
ncbi:M12 family metallopeptidase [Silvanigrella aquatica]|uniref:Peptidase M12A domain-containing protein n=1 Tax=Silvanigrella aquatica TaxID=1915309 RepID=A0A1L4CZ48_9BACT|nr:M12 family metallopeptidase [Silvanigrella aquatica]APJ03226.1 hypothetical protein AXG55_04630 [Silvanigrella aquatica]